MAQKKSDKEQKDVVQVAVYFSRADVELVDKEADREERKRSPMIRRLAMEAIKSRQESREVAAAK